MIEIMAHQLNQLIETKANITIVNVLSQEAYDDCHIPGSISIPLSELEEHAKKKLNPNKEIIVYCASYQCSASKNAFNVLKKLGFINVRTYEGGIKEWRELGYPTEGPCTMSYLFKK